MARLTAEECYEWDDRVIGNAIKLRFFPLAVESGRGCRLRDVDGKEYLDLTAGWGVASLGYSNPRVREAVREELERTTFNGLISSINRPSLELAERLIALTPGGFQKKAWFGFCGSEASEIVGRLLPLATGKRRVLGFIGGYHGSTDASMSLSSHAAQTRFIGGGNVIRAPYPDPYRCPFGEGVDDCAEKTIRYIEDYLLKTICPPHDTSAVIVEAVQSDSGDVVPPPDFLPKLEQLCRRHGLYLVIDEVKVGLGRTGKMFAFEHAGVSPDVVILGKPLGGGLPVSAIVGRKELLDAGNALAIFSSAGYGLGAAAGLATLSVIQQDGLIENAGLVGSYLHEKLSELKNRHRLIGDVRGLGLIQGMELVRDQRTKEPATKETAKVVYRAFELGLLVFYVGTFSNVLEMTPPLILSKPDVDEAVQILDQALTDVEEDRISDAKIARFAGW